MGKSGVKTKKAWVKEVQSQVPNQDQQIPSQQVLVKHPKSRQTNQVKS